MARKAQSRKNGSGTLVKRGAIWSARWMVDGKLFTKTTGTGNKREAEQILAELTAPFNLESKEETLRNFSSRLEGVQAEIRQYEDAQPAMTILEGWGAYLTSTRRPDTGEATLGMYESQYNRLVEWMKREYPDAIELRQISPQIAKEFARYLGATLSANSFNKYMTLFRRMWKVLESDAKLTCNPWSKDEISPKTEMPHTRRELTVEELQAVCGAVDGEMRLLFAVGIYTGLRLGDCVNLTWGEVDLVRGIISVAPRKTAKKSRGKRAIIPIHSTLGGMLQEIPANQRRGYVMPELQEIHGRADSILSRKIQNVFKKCGIETTSEGENDRKTVDVGFHSLRHTFVSLSANAGVPLAVVQAIVGHSNPSMTRHYFHESRDALEGAVCALPDVMQAEACVVDEVAREAERLKARFSADELARLVGLLG